MTSSSEHNSPTRNGAREVARRVLARVADGSWATPALAGELARGNLSDSDRALAMELVHGVLKRRTRLDRALAALAPRGLGSLDVRVLDALRMAAHQILFLRVPAHAAVDDAVGAIRRTRGERLAGFVNALLRKLATAGEPPLPQTSDKIADLAIAESLPRELVERVRASVGDEELAAALAAFNAPSPTWLRANTLRTTRDALADRLRGERDKITLTTTPLAPDALAARGGGDLFSTQSAAAGDFSAQDLGAQLVTRLVAPLAGEHILDACAGVGGKSTHLAALCRDAAHIDAADLARRKLDLADDLAHRLGVKSVRCVVADLTSPTFGGAPIAAAYDRVLLDAPCSGLGVLRRHPEARWRVSADDIRALAALQDRLLDNLAPRVRPGGVLVYAVCSFTEEEGPQRIARFLAAHPDFTVEPATSVDKNFAPCMHEDGSLRTWPHRHDADAFYAVRMRRAPR